MTNKEQVCPECKGTREQQASDFMHKPVLKLCHVCKGTGKLSEKPSEIQIKKFWEWCGVQEHPVGISKAERELGYVTTGGWEYPDIDLNNLFKWAVPKLYELGWEYHLIGYTYHTVDLYKGKRRISSKGLKKPDLALFWAIYKAAGLEE